MINHMMTSPFIIDKFEPVFQKYHYMSYNCILWHDPFYFTENVSDLKRGISPGSQGDLTNKCSDEI